MDRSSRAFAIVLFVALAAAAYLAYGRMAIERRNHVVEVIVDADDARRVAAGAGVTVPALLAELHRAGATALGVREVELREALTAGSVTLQPMSSGLWLTAADAASAAQLAAALRGKLPRLSPRVVGSTVIVEGVTADQLAEVPLELRREDLAAAKAAGLRVVARLGNFDAASPEAVEAAAASAETAGARLVVFRDDQVLGFQSLIGDTAQAFRRHHLLFGFVEIAQQKGEEALAVKLTPDVVRVHSITDADLETITPEVAVIRYARAVRERSIRACYVRLMTRAQADPLGANTRYLASVVKGITEEGFAIGPPEPLSVPLGWPSAPAKLLVVLALPATLALLLGRLAPASGRVVWGVFVLVAVPFLGLAAMNSGAVPAFGGLLTASVFPALGLTIALQQARGSARAPLGSVLAQAVKGLVLASVWSALGGLVIVGLYARPDFLQGIGVFAGVKASYLLPIVVVLLVVLADLSGERESLSAWYARARDTLADFLRSPIAWGGAIVMVVTMAAVALTLIRSGNDAAVAPSGLELKMRNLLEAVFIARPRTKEFLIGHPALMLALALAARGRRTWLPLAALIAVIGQVSLLNTFCHFHIPLYLGVLRTVHGVWIGALLGVVAILIWRTACDRDTQAGK